MKMFVNTLFCNLVFFLFQTAFYRLIVTFFNPFPFLCKVLDNFGVVTRFAFCQFKKTIRTSSIVTITPHGTQSFKS